MSATVVAAASGSSSAMPVPILFNDHHVMASPDKLQRGRVLAALVRGNTVLVPLRSMFEGMGATVSYDAGTRTVHVSKSGADVSVRVGVPEVTVNGETRPLDVPPEMYHGHPHGSDSRAFRGNGGLRPMAARPADRCGALRNRDASASRSFAAASANGSARNSDAFAHACTKTQERSIHCGRLHGLG